MAKANDIPAKEIIASRVRYIKLGREGKWEQECLQKGILRFGFGTHRKDRFSFCTAGEWPSLTKSFLAEGKIQGSATRFTNECRRFFEDDGTTLWITFVGDRLHWAFLSPDQAECNPDGEGTRRKVSGKWRSSDLQGNPLMKSALAGGLTKMAAYRGTSCDADLQIADYVIRRINGEKRPEVEQALKSLSAVKSAALGVIRLLQDKDFELLVDLVFSTSGWRRIGGVGKTQKTVDLDIMLPSTQEHAFVQIKSKTTKAELADYVRQFEEAGHFDRMFYVYHSGKAEMVAPDESITVIGPDRLAEMVVQAGLVDWVIQKVS